MNVGIGTVSAQFLSWRYVFRIFGIASCSVHKYGTRTSLQRAKSRRNEANRYFLMLYKLIFGKESFLLFKVLFYCDLLNIVDIFLSSPHAIPIAIH
jgi:hypothetical protein